MTEKDMNLSEPANDRVAAWITLSHCHGVGPILLKRILEALGSPERILNASASELSAIDGIGPQRAAAILQSAESFDGNAVLAECQSRGVRVL
ncbi:MAG TPA: helix-hairpin-helix domain-containing protein, partial [Phycisphaerae bacterium]|nr:helix-hairpin-helix domain-containing protein [Phycisphaerae bacterium]